MRNPALYNALESWMNRAHAPTDVVRRFEQRWHQLRQHDAYPCPKCFFEESSAQPLFALESVGKVETLVCPKCHERYYVRLTK